MGSMQPTLIEFTTATDLVPHTQSLQAHIRTKSFVNGIMTHPIIQGCR